MIRMPIPPFFAHSNGSLRGNTTLTDPRSQRIRASRKGRPCNELGLAAQAFSAACPHLCAPGTPCPRWAHHTANLTKWRDSKGAEIIMPDNGMAEAFVKTFKRDYVR